MDQYQSNSQGEYVVNLSTLPTELLVCIISFLPLLRDRVKLRYVSRWLRSVIEGTQSLWNEFVWPYYDSLEEHTLKEVLKVCVQHIKLLSFPYSKLPSTLVEMLQYCSNVLHLSLPSTKLNNTQLRKTIHCMRCLQTLELMVGNDTDIKQLLYDTNQLRELKIISDYYDLIDSRKLFKHWKELQFMPPSFKVFTPRDYGLINYLAHSANRPTNIPTGTTAKFRIYDSYSKVPLSSSPLFPCFQFQIEGCGQVTTPCVKLSDFGILELKNDVAVMTNCQYDGRTMYMVSFCVDHSILNEIMSSAYISKQCDLVCTTDFDMYNCYLLYSHHLEKLAIGCPNFQSLNLNTCSRCLESLQGLQAIASHCHNLQGLNLHGICILKVEDQIKIWEILGDMKLSHLTIECCVLRSKAAIKKTLIQLYRKCRTIVGIQTDYYCDHCSNSINEDGFMLP